ncbi:MAG: metal ABC transporter permease [Candidatus Omnitrophota bacterium]
MMPTWFEYEFMRNAFVAALLIAPLFALLGTVVVSNRMVFFSDVLGHSSLTGIALGCLLGFADPLWAVAIFAVILAVLINFCKARTRASADTVLGVFFAVVVAVGIVILSKAGGFSKYSGYLIGDILAVNKGHLLVLGSLLGVVAVYWFFAANALVLMTIDQSLARTRRIPVFWLETSFSVVLALVVAVSIKLVGILIINSLLVLPVAAARLVSRKFSDYTCGAVIISVVSSVSGLICSYYWGTASGATIVLFSAAFYGVIAGISIFSKRV